VIILSEVDPEEIRRMYEEEGMSIREIAKELEMTKGQVEYLMDKFGINRRSLREAMLLSSLKARRERAEEAKTILEESLKQLHVRKKKYTPIKRRHLLVPLPGKEEEECSLTIVISDIHIGDANHLPDTYWSTIVNLKEVLKFVKNKYKIKHLFLILNGDIVSGRNVYKYQELNNLLQRGHWQVFMAEYVVKKTIKEIEDTIKKEVDRLYLVRGTHENLANNFILYLKRMFGDKTWYLSHGGVVNIAGSLGEYNVFFTHGYGNSRTCPVPSNLLVDVLSRVDDYKQDNIQIERICTGHTHWLTSSIIYRNLYWDVTGGFMKWEKTLSHRLPGILVYLYSNNDVSCIPVRPDMEIYEEELNSPGLEYKNLKYYGEYLLKHLTEIERR